MFRHASLAWDSLPMDTDSADQGEDSIPSCETHTVPVTASECQRNEWSATVGDPVRRCSEPHVFDGAGPPESRWEVEESPPDEGRHIINLQPGPEFRAGKLPLGCGCPQCASTSPPSSTSMPILIRPGRGRRVPRLHARRHGLDRVSPRSPRSFAAFNRRSDRQLTLDHPSRRPALCQLPRTR
jgi:hypothetical protein